MNVFYISINDKDVNMDTLPEEKRIEMVRQLNEKALVSIGYQRERRKVS